MYLFMEDKSISESATCSGWIKGCLGSSALAEVAHQKVTHSTIVLGTSSFAVEYARQMSQGLLSADFQACESAGVDNGLHNYLLYTSGGEGVLRFDQFSGPVIDVEVIRNLTRNVFGSGERRGTDRFGCGSPGAVHWRSRLTNTLG